MATMVYVPGTLSPEDREQEQRLRGLVSQYVDGRLSLDDFEDAFTAASWDADRFAEAVQSFTYQVEHRLAEHRDALTSEAELRAELQQLRALVWHTPKRATSSNIMVTARHVRLPRRL